jgi:phage tail sheath protein FI
MIYIMQSIKDGMAFARHKNIDEDLMSRVRRTADDFLERQLAAGAFDSRVKANAFRFQCDEKNNPASTRRLKRLIMDLGTNMASTAIWVVARFSQYLGEEE